MAEIQPGMPVYSSDGQALGTVEGIGSENLRVAGQDVLLSMVSQVTEGRVELNYTAPQFLWHFGSRQEQNDAVSWDPSGIEGHITDMVEQAERRDDREGH